MKFWIVREKFEDEGGNCSDHSDKQINAYHDNVRGAWHIKHEGSWVHQRCHGPAIKEKKEKCCRKID